MSDGGGGGEEIPAGMEERETVERHTGTFRQTLHYNGRWCEPLDCFTPCGGWGGVCVWGGGGRESQQCP